MTSQRNLDLAAAAKAHGANYSLRIVLEARRVDIPVSLGFALIEQESGFNNVYGHDRVANRILGGSRVTKANYLGIYLPDRKAGKGMQGVGPAQLTWWQKQDRADSLGGCWVARWNIRVAFEDLADLMRTHGPIVGIQRYNGTGPAAEAYATSVLALKKKWHGRLAP